MSTTSRSPLADTLPHRVTCSFCEAQGGSITGTIFAIDNFPSLTARKHAAFLAKVSRTHRRGQAQASAPLGGPGSVQDPSQTLASSPSSSAPGPDSSDRVHRSVLLGQETTEAVQRLAAHVLDAHRVKVEDLFTIANIQEYLSHWASEIDNLRTLLGRTSDAVIELSNSIQPDRELRGELQFRLISRLVEIQQEELSAFSKDRACPFCDTIVTGSHSQFFSHLFQRHHVNVGQAENMVEKDEFIASICSKIESGVCIYCEKNFRTKQVLKSHMRKKKHLRLNPYQHEYDRHYLVNFVDSDKSWESMEHDRRSDISHSRTHSDDNDSSNDDHSDREPGHSDDDQNWDDWEADEEEVREDSATRSLFDDSECPTVEEALEQAKAAYGFDLVEVLNKLKLDVYGRIRVINYIRKQVQLNQCLFCDAAQLTRAELVDHMKDAKHFDISLETAQSLNDQYLFPTIADDTLLRSLLCFDGDDEDWGENAGTDGDDDEDDEDEEGEAA